MAAAQAARDEVLVAGVAGLVAGAMPMATGEYVSVSSRADTEAADLEREMEEGAWLAMPYDAGLAFSARIDDLWRRCFERLGLNPALLTGGSGRKH